MRSIYLWSMTGTYADAALCSPKTAAWLGPIFMGLTVYEDKYAKEGWVYLVDLDLISHGVSYAPMGR